MRSKISNCAQFIWQTQFWIYFFLIEKQSVIKKIIFPKKSIYDFNEYFIFFIWKFRCIQSLSSLILTLIQRCIWKQVDIFSSWFGFWERGRLRLLMKKQVLNYSEKIIRKLSVHLIKFKIVLSGKCFNLLNSRIKGRKPETIQ